MPPLPPITLLGPALPSRARTALPSRARTALPSRARTDPPSSRAW